MPQNPVETAGIVNVVGIKVGEDIAARYLQSLVYGVCLAVVLPRNVPDSSVVALQNRKGVIGAATIENKNLHWTTLAQETVQRVPEELTLIVGRNNNADCHDTFWRAEFS